MQRKRDAGKDSELYKYIILNNVEISPDVYLISFKRDFDFAPGQVVKIGVDRNRPAM